MVVMIVRVVMRVVFMRVATSLFHWFIALCLVFTHNPMFVIMIVSGVRMAMAAIGTMLVFGVLFVRMFCL